jgi:hypothetical protein
MGSAREMGSVKAIVSETRSALESALAWAWASDSAMAMATENESGSVMAKAMPLA